MGSKTFIFKDVNYGDRQHFEVDGIRYEIGFQGFDCNEGYASCLIIDTSNGNTYQSYGSIELNNHIINTKWKYEYDYHRSNYVPAHELIVEII